MRRPSSRSGALVVACAAFVVARPARADDPPPQIATASADVEPPKEPPKEPDEEVVVVRGRTTPPSRGASDFNLKVGELSRVPRQNAADLLKLAPGILLTNKGGDGH